MVRATKVGKPRPWWRGLLLTIVTFGLYQYYWKYKAHDEVYKQFELEDEGKDQGVVWLILGLIINPLIFVYDYFFVSNYNYLTHRLGIRQRIGPAGFILLEIFGGIPLVLGIGFIVASLLSGSDPQFQDVAEVASAVLAVGAVLAAIGAFLVVLPYYKLQEGINDVWAAYDARMAELQRGQGTAPSVGGAAGSQVPAWAAGTAGAAGAAASDEPASEDSVPGAGTEPDLGAEEE